MMFRQLCAAATVAMALAFAACGDDDDGNGGDAVDEAQASLNIAGLEKSLQNATSAESADCTEPETAEKGAQFTCTVTVDVGKVTLDMTQEDADGTKFSYEGKASAGGLTQEFTGTVVVS